MKGKGITRVADVYSKSRQRGGRDMIDHQYYISIVGEKEEITREGKARVSERKGSTINKISIWAG